MTEDEVDAVAKELAKVGGASWYPGRTEGPLLRVVSERYKDRARVAIAALDRFRSAADPTSSSEQTGPAQGAVPSTSLSNTQVQLGSIVVYRPPGDQRAISCRVEQLEADRAYLVPVPHPIVGWVSLESLEAVGEQDVSTTPEG